MEKFTARFRRAAVTPERAAERIIERVERNRYWVYPSRDIQLGHFFHRKRSPVRAGHAGSEQPVRGRREVTVNRARLRSTGERTIPLERLGDSPQPAVENRPGASLAGANLGRWALFHTMRWTGDQPLRERVLELARAQYDVIARQQLLDLEMHPRSIEHWLSTGRLHRIFPGVYAVGRPTVSARGMRMAAVLACGPFARLSHGSGAAHWRVGMETDDRLEISIPSISRRRPPGIVAHRRSGRAADAIDMHERVPVTPLVLTLIDYAATRPRAAVAKAVNEADKLDLITPDALRKEIEQWSGVPGIGALRELLDESTFVLTESELERLFVPIARSAGLPQPLTQQQVNGVRVDFFWPELGLVVETDGLRYHRTAEQQARDTVRTHAHLAAGLTPVRFTHGQVRYKPGYVRARLVSIARRLHRRIA